MTETNVSTIPDLLLLLTESTERIHFILNRCQLLEKEVCEQSELIESLEQQLQNSKLEILRLRQELAVATAQREPDQQFLVFSL